MEEELKQIKVTASRIYAGRTWEQLTPEERSGVYETYEGLRGMAGILMAPRWSLSPRF